MFNRNDEHCFKIDCLIVYACACYVCQVEGSITQKVEEVESLRNALESAKRVGLEADEKANAWILVWIAYL